MCLDKGITRNAVETYILVGFLKNLTGKYFEMEEKNN
jgi:hypothetical protein